MKKILTEKAFANTFCVLAIVLFGVLFYFSLTETWINDLELTTEYVAPMRDSLFQNVLWLGIVLAGSILLYWVWQQQKFKCNLDVIAGILCVLAFAFSIYWIYGTGATPQADQAYICKFAEAFEQGDLSGLEKGKYVAIYRQQLGLITFVRLLYKIFGLGNYQAYQYFNALMIPVMIFSGYKIVQSLSSKSGPAEIFYLILIGLCFPMYGYVPFVYGEIASTALVMLAGWLLLWNGEHFSVVRVLLLSLALGVAVQLRKNVLIFVIAFGIVLLIQLLRGNKKQLLITLGGILAGIVILQAVIDGIYARYIPEDSHPAPASVFIAMGVNSDNGMAGWHNFYDQFTFYENDHDVAKTNQAAAEYLREFAEDCVKNPGYAFDFYYRKICSQWNAPMYQCLAMTNGRDREQTAFVSELYFGRFRGLTEAQMNIHQLLVYGGVLAFLLLAGKGCPGIERYLLLIGVFGGFLFSVLWEAKTRYCFPYYLLMLPYAATGIFELVRAIGSKKWRLKATGEEGSSL